VKRVEDADERRQDGTDRVNLVQLWRYESLKENNLTHGRGLNRAALGRPHRAYLRMLSLVCGTTE